MSKTAAPYKARLRQQYTAEIIPLLQKDLKLSNPHQAPQLRKIIVSIGLGKGKDDKKLFTVAETTLRKITGQSPIQTKARKSIAGFKLRDGNPIGMKVTLRGERMYEFLDRLISVVLPRLRDFHGVSRKSFDKQGNYSLGLSEQSIFPELSFEDTTLPHGLEVTLVIENQEPQHSVALLEALGMPFEKVKEKN